MKITRIETIPVRVPLRPQFAIKSGRGGSHTLSPFLIVKIHTDAGIVGLGEASCTPRWSGEDQFSAAHFINEYFAPPLIGADPTDIEGTTAKFSSTVANNPFTKSAVEMALWDIAGKAANKPVYELLGGRVREIVPIKWSISGREPEIAAEIARWAMAKDFAMKVKVGIDMDGDIARVSAVRVAVGSQTHLGVDANGGWKIANTALRAIENLLAFDPYFVEQPTTAFDLEAMSRVRSVAKLPIVADESVYTIQDARNLSHAKAANVLSIYVGKAGGIGPAREIAAFAQSAGMKCTIGSNLELGIGSAAMLHLALATSGIDCEAYPCDIIGPFYYEDDVLVEPLDLSGGLARIRDTPGLGVEIDDAKLEKYRVR